MTFTFWLWLLKSFLTLSHPIWSRCFLIPPPPPSSNLVTIFSLTILLLVTRVSYLPPRPFQSLPLTLMSHLREAVSRLTVSFCSSYASPFALLGWFSNRTGKSADDGKSARKVLHVTSGAQFSALPLVKPVVWFARAVVNWRSRSVAKSAYYLRKYLWMTKSQLCAKQICLPRILSNITNNKNGFWKTVRRTNVQKPQLHSSFYLLDSLSTRVSFCILLCYLYLILTFWAFIFMFHSVWILINLVTQLL